MQKTDITVVLDRSGSMQGRVNDTIGGFNNFLKEQQSHPGEARFTLVQFDHEYEVPVNGVDIRYVAPLSDETYTPRGSTALLDAVNRAIGEADRRVQQGELVVFVIITDGQENCSREISKSALKALIETKQGKGWQFIYLGANQDAFAEAGAFGVRAQTISNYSPFKYGETFDCIASNVSQYRTSGALCDVEFSAEQKAAIN